MTDTSSSKDYSVHESGSTPGMATESLEDLLTDEIAVD
jgi:hypothetical protein